MPQVNTLVLSRKMMFQKQKKQGTEKRNRFLITVNVVGSAGPLRFVVKEDDPVAGVIESALKAYARGGRVPVLGSDVKNFMLYCANGTSEALSPQEAIGSRGARNFVLCKKQLQPQMTEGRSELMRRKASGWKAWLSKSFSFSL